MKKTLILLSMMLMGMWTNAQTLYAPLQQFADVCLQEKEAIRSESMKDNDRYEQLYTCMQAFADLPLTTGEKILNPSNNPSLEQMSGHIVFSLSFINMYLQQNMRDTYPHVFPYVPGASHREEKRERGQEYVIYHNSLLAPNSNATFSYNALAGEQQLIVIAEDDTPLDIKITSDKGTSLHVSTNAPKGVASQIWNEGEYAKMLITVTNPTNKYVSFVIAVH